MCVVTTENHSDAFANCIIQNVWQVLGHSKDANVLRLATAILLSKVFHFFTCHTHISSKIIQTRNVDNHVLITIQVVWHTSLQSLTGIRTWLQCFLLQQPDGYLLQQWQIQTMNREHASSPSYFIWCQDLSNMLATNRAEFLHLTCNTSNCQLFLTTAISTWSVYQCFDSEDTLDCQVDSVVLQCNSVRKNQDNLGILQKDHSQHVMYYWAIMPKTYLWLYQLFWRIHY